MKLLLVLNDIMVTERVVNEIRSKKGNLKSKLSLKLSLGLQDTERMQHLIECIAQFEVMKRFLASLTGSIMISIF